MSPRRSRPRPLGRLLAIDLLAVGLLAVGPVSFPGASAPALAAPPGPDGDVPLDLSERIGGTFSPNPEPAAALESIATPRYVWASDLGRTLPAPPWSTDSAFTRAFELARSAWRRHAPLDPQILVVFSTFSEGGRAVFYTPLANDVQGLGSGPEAAIFDRTPGSPLEGWAWLGPLEGLRSVYPGYEHEAFVHEIVHRWGAYLRLSHPTLPEDVLLGRAQTHWSFRLHTEASVMEGNDWQPETHPRWHTVLRDQATPHLSPLDLYVMGVLSPEDVPPIRIMHGLGGLDPSWMSVDPEATPSHRLGTSLSAIPTRVDYVSIEDVVAANGPRIPAASAPQQLRVGVVLLSDGHEKVSPEGLAAFDRELEALVASFDRATGQRMTLDVEIASAGRLGLGEACSSLADCDRRVADACAGVPAVCTRTETDTPLEPADAGAGASSRDASAESLPLELAAAPPSGCTQGGQLGSVSLWSWLAWLGAWGRRRRHHRS